MSNTACGGIRRHAAFSFAAAITLIAASATSANAQFFASRSFGGEMVVVDSAGTPLDVVTSDPVGERPGLCPDAAYYVAELPTDISELVLTDCATGQGRYTVEMQTSIIGGS